MKVLIVESVAELARVWKRHLERHGIDVMVRGTGDAAASLICSVRFDVIILDLVLSEGSAIAVADMAQYRQPETNVIFVTDTTFFSDGSIFALTANARVLVQCSTPPEDIVAMVEHYAGR